MKANNQHHQSAKAPQGDSTSCPEAPLPDDLLDRTSLSALEKAKYDLDQGFMMHLLTSRIPAPVEADEQARLEALRECTQLLQQRIEQERKSLESFEERLTE